MPCQLAKNTLLHTAFSENCPLNVIPIIQYSNPDASHPILRYYIANLSKYKTITNIFKPNLYLYIYNNNQMYNQTIHVAYFMQL